MFRRKLSEIRTRPNFVEPLRVPLPAITECSNKQKKFIESSINLRLFRRDYNNMTSTSTGVFNAISMQSISNLPRRQWKLFNIIFHN